VIVASWFSGYEYICSALPCGHHTLLRLQKSALVVAAAEAAKLFSLDHVSPVQVIQLQLICNWIAKKILYSKVSRICSLTLPVTIALVFRFGCFAVQRPPISLQRVHQQTGYQHHQPRKSDRIQRERANGPENPAGVQVGDHNIRAHSEIPILRAIRRRQQKARYVVFVQMQRGRML
jgi:hypothetical protein